MFLDILLRFWIVRSRYYAFQDVRLFSLLHVDVHHSLCSSLHLPVLASTPRNEADHELGEPSCRRPPEGSSCRENDSPPASPSLLYRLSARLH